MIEFAAPAALLALLSVPLILYLYRLRPRRREHSISSITLWTKALRRRPSTGLARLLRNVSLLLLLATALLLALSLADPKWLESRPSPADVILIVDASASMQAKTKDKNRFTRAIETAREIVAARPEGARTAVVSSASRARLILPFETRKSALDNALAALQVTDETGQPELALELAASLQTRRDNNEILFLTDGALSSESITPRAGLRVVQFGSDAANVGITRFQVRAHPRTSGQFAAFARIHNFAGAALTTRARLDVAGSTVKQVELDIAADSSTVLNTEFNGLGGERVTLSLEASDALAVDNQAFAVLPTRAPLLVSVSANLLESQAYLASALDAMPHVGVVADTAGRQARDSRTARQQAVDVIVTNDPMQIKASGNYLVFGANAAAGLVTTGAQVASTGTVALRNPLLGAALDTSDISVRSATLIRPVPASVYRYEPLLRVPDGDIAAALLGPASRIVLFAFAPGDTSLPMRPAWPILLDEALTWLAGETRPGTTTAVKTGSSVRVATDVVNGTARLVMPGGVKRELDIIDGEVSLGDLREAGFYTVTRGDIYRLLAANLTSTSESDVRPRLGDTSATPVSKRAQTEQSSTLWPWLLLFALLALAFETALNSGLGATYRERRARVKAQNRRNAAAT